MRFFSLVSLASLFLMAGSAFAETKTYTMRGMTCGSCVKAVSNQVCKLPGIEKCEVDINKMTLTGTLNDSAIAQAVEKAGFALVAPKVEAPAPATPPKAPAKARH